MFVAERATNIIRQSTFGGNRAIFHVQKFETNLFCPKGSLFFLSPLSGERKINIIPLRSLRLCGEKSFLILINMSKYLLPH